MNILDCKIKLPTRGFWRGHSFYYDVLQCYEKLPEKSPRFYEQILSMPIWFNKYLNTSFDESISKAGFNYVKDIFPSGRLINLNNLQYTTLNFLQKQQINTIAKNVPKYWQNCINEKSLKCTVINPLQTINVNGYDQQLRKLDSKFVYGILINEKIQLPVGMLH